MARTTLAPTPSKTPSKTLGKTLASRSRGGAVAVEFAVCLPVLIVILFSCYEFSHANLLLHATESAAYEATRTAIVPGATRAQVERSVRTVLNSVGANDFGLNITPDLSITNSETVRVEISVPFRRNSSVLRMFITDPTFRGSCELTRERL